MERRLILNRIKTPDGTILTSYNRHDYKTHIDKVTGEEYMVDGGLDYRRGSWNETPAEDLSVYSDEPFEKVRESMHWGTRGPAGDQPVEYKPLSELTNPHIQAILKTQHHIPKWLEEIFLNELMYREKNDCHKYE